MADVTLGGSTLGSSLSQILQAEDLEPGSTPSYEACKILFAYHPLGKKMAEAPTVLAQSQKREIVVEEAPHEDVVKEFEKTWSALGCDKIIFNLVRQSRIYGVASVGLLVDGEDAAEPIDWKTVGSKSVTFNVFDPLNTAGSLVLNQDPNAPDFQKHLGIRVQGQHYHRTREITILNEEPIYILYTSSAFGFVGRSVYQRAFFPMKTFVQTMRTDDLVSVKVSAIVAKLKQVGSIVNQAMKTAFGLKRNVVKEAQIGGVISIGTEESIESLNLQNLDGPHALSRGNCLKNIATAADMPAVLLENETLTEGFGEGTEDAKNIAKFVDRHREEIEPAYKFFDEIVMYRAWTPEFYATIRERFPDQYGDVSYDVAFSRWRNSFKAKWPSLLTEPDSEKAKTEKVKLEGVTSIFTILSPTLDPENKAKLVQWAVEQVNDMDLLFSTDLDFDVQDLLDYVPPAPPGMGEGGEGGGPDQLAPPRPVKVA